MILAEGYTIINGLYLFIVFVVKEGWLIIGYADVNYVKGGLLSRLFS